LPTPTLHSVHVHITSASMAQSLLISCRFIVLFCCVYLAFQGGCVADLLVFPRSLKSCWKDEVITMYQYPLMFDFVWQIHQSVLTCCIPVGISVQVFTASFLPALTMLQWGTSSRCCHQFVALLHMTSLFIFNLTTSERWGVHAICTFKAPCTPVCKLTESSVIYCMYVERPSTTAVVLIIQQLLYCRLLLAHQLPLLSQPQCWAIKGDPINSKVPPVLWQPLVEGIDLSGHLLQVWHLLPVKHLPCRAIDADLEHVQHEEPCQQSKEHHQRQGGKGTEPVCAAPGQLSAATQSSE